MFENRMKFVLSAVVVLSLALAFTPAAFAATSSAPMGISATVVATCSVTPAVGGLQFGNYSGAVINQSTTISVTCTNTTPYNVGLGAGTATGETDQNRWMTNGTQTLNYVLHATSSSGPNWGNTSATNWQPGTGNGTAQTMTIFGVVAAGQAPTPGAYSDTITVTVNY